MTDDRTRERLSRLRREPRPPASAARVESAPETLASVEMSLLGSAGAELSLKQRLERLVAAAKSRSGTGRNHGAPLEELVAGAEVENARGRFFLVEEQRPLDH